MKIQSYRFLFVSFRYNSIFVIFPHGIRVRTADFKHWREKKLLISCIHIAVFNASSLKSAPEPSSSEELCVDWAASFSDAQSPLGGVLCVLSSHTAMGTKRSADFFLSGFLLLFTYLTFYIFYLHVFSFL